jgi:predicted TIM-barrel fold metal-dependent hydrolase
MPFIDFHAHCLDPRLLPEEFWHYRAQTVLATRPGVTEEELQVTAAKIARNTDDSDGALLIGDLRAAGVDHAALVGLDWAALGRPTPETDPAYQLEWARSIVERSDGLISFVFGIDPRRENSEALTRAALAEEWVRGVKFYPPVGFSPADDVCRPIYAAAVEHGKFLMAHTGRQTYPFQLEYARLEAYGKVQHDFPDIQLVLAHAGYPLFHREAIEVARGHRTTYLEVSGWHHAIGSDLLTDFLRSAIGALGSHRILFGSDHMSGRRTSGERSQIAQWRTVFDDLMTELGGDPAAGDLSAARLLGYEVAGV